MVDVIGPPTVVVIQRDPERERRIEWLLLAEGCETIAETNVDEARLGDQNLAALATRYNAQIIVCDTPPSVTGKRLLLRSIRNVRATRRCRVVVTTPDPAADAELLFDAGATAIVGTPASDDALAGALRQALVAAVERDE